MKLAISNIAWDRNDEPSVQAVLHDAGVFAIEVAPTKIWPNPASVKTIDADRFRLDWQRRGFHLVAMQALLFGRPDLALFEGEVRRVEMLSHLTRVMELAATLGIGPLVFGSPRNRSLGSLSKAEGWSVAVDFFGALAHRAVGLGVQICIEPNPPQYGCDFIVTLRDGIDLVNAVNSPGFRLHVDSSALILNGENVSSALAAAHEWVAHVHLSEPFLAVPGEHLETHRQVATELRRRAYGGYVSIEMRSGQMQNNADAIQAAVAVAMTAYGAVKT